MGLSERDYMREPEEPRFSNIAATIIAVILVAFVLQIYRSRQRDLAFVNLLDDQFAQQFAQVDSATDRRSKLAEVSPLDINSATYEQLRLLPRITDAIASGIIDGRPFSEIDQLDDVYGIGPKTLALIRPHVFVMATSKTDEVSVPRDEQ